MGNDGSNDNTSKLFSAISPPPFSSLYRKWIHNSMIYPLRDTIYGERPMISYPFPPYAKRISSAKQISYRQVYHPFPQGTDIIVKSLICLEDKSGFLHGFSHGLSNSPPDCLIPSLRSGRPFKSRHSDHKKEAALRPLFYDKE